MTMFRFITAAAPIALVGALLTTGITGCSSPSSAESSPADPAEAVESVTAVGTGVTSLDDLRWGVIDSDDPELNESMEELVLALNAASPGGLMEVNINCHWANSIDVSFLTEDESGVIHPEQLQAMLDVLMNFDYPVEIDKMAINGFNNNYIKGDVLAAAAELGVNPEFIDDKMYNRLEVGSADVKNLLS